MSVPVPPISKTWVDRLRLAVAGVRWMTLRALLGFQNVWAMLVALISILDDGERRLWQGFYARLPGLGTPTALPLIGQSRGLFRGIGESDDAFALWLRDFLQKWEKAGGGGSEKSIALLKQIQHYCGGVKVKSITRAGKLLTLEADGTVTKQMIAWDWDSKSNPDKAGHWSEMWIIVYDPPWARRGKWGNGIKWGVDTLGLGHEAPRNNVDELLSIFAEWKANRTRINTVCFTYDNTLFDETTPATMPDGWFGRWGKPDPADPTHTIPSRFADVRYWHPNAYRHGEYNFVDQGGS